MSNADTMANDKSKDTTKINSTATTSDYTNHKTDTTHERAQQCDEAYE